MSNNFTHYNGDPLYAAAAAILEGKQIETPSDLEEGVEEIKAKVKDIKVGDKTNFGVVVAIDGSSITFKAKDLPKTKIAFNQRKTGSKDFVLDRLGKLKEDVAEETEITEAVNWDVIHSMYLKDVIDVVLGLGLAVGTVALVGAKNGIKNYIADRKRSKEAAEDAKILKSALDKISKDSAASASIEKLKDLPYGKNPEKNSARKKEIDVYRNRLKTILTSDEYRQLKDIYDETIREDVQTSVDSTITEAVGLASDTLKGQVVSLLQLNTSVKVAHWHASTSVNTHKALGDLYDAIESGLDSFIETEMGISRNRQFLNMSCETRGDYSVPALITELRARAEALVNTSKALGCEDLANIAADLLGAVNKAAYLLEA